MPTSGGFCWFRESEREKSNANPWPEKRQSITDTSCKRLLDDPWLSRCPRGFPVHADEEPQKYPHPNLTERILKLVQEEDTPSNQRRLPRQ